MSPTSKSDVGATRDYWLTGSVPSLGGCISDLLASDLGYANYGCGGTGGCTPYGGPINVYWRFNH
jgi:hypothetical protein